MRSNTFVHIENAFDNMRLPRVLQIVENNNAPSVVISAADDIILTGNRAKVKLNGDTPGRIRITKFVKTCVN